MADNKLPDIYVGVKELKNPKGIKPTLDTEIPKVKPSPMPGGAKMWRGDESETLRKPRTESKSYRYMDTVNPPKSQIEPDPNAIRSFKKGTDYVPKTGTYKLHEGEAVIPKEKNMMANPIKDSVMGEKKPKKEIKEIRTRKAKSGGYIHEHHHTAPEHHPMEEHATQSQDGMVDHMMQHMGEPNPGEEAAEGGAEAGPMPQAGM